MFVQCPKGDKGNTKENRTREGMDVVRAGKERKVQRKTEIVLYTSKRGHRWEFVRETYLYETDS